MKEKKESAFRVKKLRLASTLLKERKSKLKLH